MAAAAQTVDKIAFNYSRIQHPYHTPLDNFMRLNHQFLTNFEQSILKVFKAAQDQEDANVFIEIDFDQFLDDLNFHIVSYEDFSSFKDPTKTKEMLYKMKDITENALQNIEANITACKNLHKINTLKTKILEESSDLKGAFGELESQAEFHSKAGELSSLFSVSEQFISRYSLLITKVKQFELFFSQDIDSLHNCLSMYDNSTVTFEKISELSLKCRDELEKIGGQLAEIIDLQFVKEDSKLVC